MERGSGQRFLTALAAQRISGSFYIALAVPSCNRPSRRSTSLSSSMSFTSQVCACRCSCQHTVAHMAGAPCAAGLPIAPEHTHVAYALSAAGLLAAAKRAHHVVELVDVLRELLGVQVHVGAARQVQAVEHAHCAHVVCGGGIREGPGNGSRSGSGRGSQGCCARSAHQCLTIRCWPFILLVGLPLPLQALSGRQRSVVGAVTLTKASSAH